jgi:hypothetical protein
VDSYFTPGCHGLKSDDLTAKAGSDMCSYIAAIAEPVQSAYIYICAAASTLCAGGHQEWFPSRGEITSSPFNSVLARNRCENAWLWAEKAGLGV